MENNNTGYCCYCNKDVTYTVIDETTALNIHGINISYEDKVPYCNECGEEVYVPKLNDESVIKGHRLYCEKLGLVPKI